MKPWIAVAACCLMAASLPAKPQMTSQINLPSLGAPAGSGELSPADERKIGEQSMEEIRQSPYYLHDPDIHEYLMRLGYRLVAAAPVTPYSFQFFPMKLGEINAFALPGGFIAVFTGTLVAAQDESELAGVMAHEIAHVTQRHIARMLENQKGNVAASLGSFLLAILAASAGGNSGGDAAAAIMMGGQAALISNQLKFSRSAEQEADRIGFQIMVRANFDPNGMTRFFQRLLQRTGPYEANASAYLSDHPLTVERIADMENRARELQRPFIRHDSFDFYLMQVQALVLQSGSSAGRDSAKVQFQTVLSKKATGVQAAVAHYGLSVVYALDGDAAQAYAEAQKAVQMAGRNDVFLQKNLLQTRYAMAADKKPVLKEIAALANDNPLSVMLAKTYIEDLYEQGMHEEILKYLKGQSAISQDNADYFRYLARSSEALGRRSEAFRATGKMYALQGDWKMAAYQFKQAQRVSDGDFFTMSEVDADLREAEDHLKQDKPHH